MEDSPLNNAHFNARKAESLLKASDASRYDCLEFLQKAIQLLDQALEQTSQPKAIESIKLQRNHHIKLRDHIQSQYEKFKKTEQKSDPVPMNERVVNANKIQLDLFENIDTTDTLLEEIKKSHPESKPAIELQKINSQLNVLLFQLITHHEETVQENDLLKEKLKALEVVPKRDKQSIPDELRRLSPDAIEAHEEFAPLDLPVFEIPDIPRDS